ncbi:peptidoglycan recognition protein [Streptomyces sp. NPDC059785]|uniref:peptidoglycan recognition protein family protein n=1 Tax=Streptomyces sp. NPDC059785 TaxID=3346945 RepID=UPI003658DD77
MRGFLASSIGVTCAAALALPGALPASAATSAEASAAAAIPSVPASASAPGRSGAAAVPGSTQSLPLVPLTAKRASGSAAPPQGVVRRDVRPFSLLGVVWNDPDAELNGRVQVRTRPTGGRTWSGWQDVETHNHEHAADPGTAERTSGRVRGATAPLWVGDSDGVELRVRARTDDRTGHRTDGRDGRTGHRTASAAGSSLPRGLHLELVDPGDGPAAKSAAGGARTAVSAVTGALAFAGGAVASAGDVAGDAAGDAVPGIGTGLAPSAPAVLPALSRQATVDEARAEGAAGGGQRVQPYIGPRPRIVTRRGWGADEGLRERGFAYTKRVKAAFVHHTATGNKYSCSRSASVIRSIYRYHVSSQGWRDIGYNFLVDKCGNIYEGRAGGVTKAVKGAHTLGFNSNSMGIAVIGSFGSAKAPARAVRAVSKLTAWKLGLFGANPRGKTYLKSAGGNLYRKGKNVRLNVISGHRDGFATDCPGRRLYGKLGSARSSAARYQGR